MIINHTIRAWRPQRFRQILIINHTILIIRRLQCSRQIIINHTILITRRFWCSRQILIISHTIKITGKHVIFLILLCVKLELSLIHFVNHALPALNGELHFSIHTSSVLNANLIFAAHLKCTILEQHSTLHQNVRMTWASEYWGLSVWGCPTPIFLNLSEESKKKTIEEMRKRWHLLFNILMQHTIILYVCVHLIYFPVHVFIFQSRCASKL